MKRVLMLLFVAIFTACGSGGGGGGGGIHVPEVVLVSSGSFDMGSPIGETDRDPDPSDEEQHRVTLNAFYIGKYEVTQKEWESVMGYNPSYFTDDENLPVDTVSWMEIIEYCNKLSEAEGLTAVYVIDGNDVTWEPDANGYRLPTEAEWEYAARGGSVGSVLNYYIFSGSDNVEEVAWLDGTHHPVGQKAANYLGLHDMSGNIGEFCWDWYDENYYSASELSNPKGPSAAVGSFGHVWRGGSSVSQVVGFARSADRLQSSMAHNDYGAVQMGFRVARSNAD